MYTYLHARRLSHTSSLANPTHTHTHTHTLSHRSKHKTSICTCTPLNSRHTQLYLHKAIGKLANIYLMRRKHSVTYPLVILGEITRAFQMNQKVKKEINFKKIIKI